MYEAAWIQRPWGMAISQKPISQVLYASCCAETNLRVQRFSWVDIKIGTKNRDKNYTMLRGFLRRHHRGRAALLRLSKRLVAGCDWLSHTLVFYFGKPIPIFGKYDETFGKISCAVCVRIKSTKECSRKEFCFCLTIENGTEKHWQRSCTKFTCPE